MDRPKIVGQLGSLNNPILITLSEIDGTRVLDIRRYYRDKSTAELQPTKKGLAITGTNFHELITALSDKQAEISGWLDGAGDLNALDAAKRRSAHLTAISSGNAHTEVEISQWRGPTFFEVAYEGAKVKVSLNKSHAFVRGLEASEDQSAFTTLLASLLCAFDAACMNTAVGDDESLLDRLQLQTAWGILLGQRLSKMGVEE